MTGRVHASDDWAASLLAEAGYEIVDATSAAEVVVAPGQAPPSTDVPVVRVVPPGQPVDEGAFAVVRPDDRDALLAAVRSALAFERAGRTDVLTGLANRRHLEEHLRMTASEARRHRRPLSVAIVDVDHLRRVNDSYGFAAGDSVIRAVSERIQHVLRTEDMAGRWGGEEFVVLLPSTDLDGAWTLAERIRDGVSGTPVALDGGGGLDLVVTVSVGCAEGGGGDVDDHLRRAMGALDHAKEAGRNRVVLDTTVVA